ncbi:N-acetylmuramoyl-L-alanine amidase [Nocardiopsis sp. NRRL B-16309]|uniref:peptidoglycan recognition protein family protein n=1 Tax=Nocardiopsis sp. NRRL B-16309 TaxID=1519494 RepID=UPI0006C1BCCB|nr:N-acetylmuramoyl-L-alanine amidase [Nocardiopsis sp. NRRL B-16309]KOX10154.1 hypothetical protein ADL05_26120 [Nocardiopsis sp. NRRL B-16309]
MPQPDKLQWRSDFGWSPYSPAGSANPRSGLVIHYDSSNQRLADKPHSACEAYWKRTRGFHTGPSRGWTDIGYSFMACAHGYVMEGRGLFKSQAAQPGGNSTYYSCTLATGPTDEVTPAQINAVRQLRSWLMEPQSSIGSTVKGHRDFNSTSCPGEKAYAMVRDGTFRRAAVWGSDVPDVDEPTKPAPPKAPKPKPPTTSAPAFPLPKGWYFGPRSGPSYSVSGFYSHRDELERWQRRMRNRGWVITPDGLYGPQTEGVARAFQREKSGLIVDGLIGANTWAAAWEEPVT